MSDKIKYCRMCRILRWCLEIVLAMWPVVLGLFCFWIGYVDGRQSATREERQKVFVVRLKSGIYGYTKYVSFGDGSVEIPLEWRPTAGFVFGMEGKDLVIGEQHKVKAEKLTVSFERK